MQGDRPASGPLADPSIVKEPWRPGPTACLRKHRFISPCTASAFKRRDDVSRAGASPRTSARRQDRRPGVSTPERCLRICAVSRDAGPAPQRRADVSGAGASLLATLRLHGHRPCVGTPGRCLRICAVSRNTGPSLERRDDVRNAGPALRTPARRPERRPVSGTPGQNLPRWRIVSGAFLCRSMRH